MTLPLSFFLPLSSSDSNVFPEVPNSFPSLLSKRVYPVSVRVHNKSAQWKPAKHEKKHHVAKLQSKLQLLFLKRLLCRERREVGVSQKGLEVIKGIAPPVINQFF